MIVAGLHKVNDWCWRVEPADGMHVPAIFYADEALLAAMDDKVFEQLTNVARLPGIVGAAYAMPDAHWGYGFPIGGVGAFDAAAGGVISVGGVGFDISCGVRLLRTNLTRKDIEAHQRALADALFEAIPAGLGSTGAIALAGADMDAMLADGAGWAVAQGWGEPADLERIEDRGRMAGASPGLVSDEAKRRQRKETGTLGSGNHYLEVQQVAELYDRELAKAFELTKRQAVVSIHCGSRGLGHQIGTDFLRAMAVAAPRQGFRPPDRELACAPIASELGRSYLGAMRAATNCALANRQILTALTRETFSRVFPGAQLDLLYDVSHNTCREETHTVDGVDRTLFVHRKGATRALGPGSPALPDRLRPYGQPVLVGGSMGVGSYVLAGAATAEAASFGSACHGAGRAMSRHAALKLYSGRKVQDDLATRGILVRSPSTRGIAEEAPGAYKDLHRIAEVTEKAGLARRVAHLEPLVCIKG
ncbi:MAG: RtcB family protein [Alphaproteobacteria bacterium]|nr:RtcB family protein [Alphaproteobacteria bacterium]